MQPCSCFTTLSASAAAFSFGAGTAFKFNVRGIPALLLFKGGQLVDQVVGLQPKENIKQVIDRHI